MKSLHLVKTAAGASWALRQMRELVKLGVDVHVAVPGDGPLVSQYEAVGVTVHLTDVDFPVRKPWAALGAISSLRELVTSVEPNIIHSHFVSTTLTARLALESQSSIPRIFQVPGPLHLEHPFFRRAEIALAGSSDFWIASCQWTANRYRDSGISDDRVFVSYYGTDTKRFESIPTGKLRAELDVNHDVKLVGMVAYMYAPKRFLGQTRGLKGHEDFIDALAVCLERRDDILGVIIGGAWNGATDYEQKVRQYARERCGDKIVLLGTRADVEQLYRDFDLAVHPSHSENLGGAVESLLCGVPTIASNVGGLPDIVRDGETGWLVPPARPSFLAATILEALGRTDKAQAYAARGKALVQQECDVSVTARQVFDIYTQVLERASVNRDVSAIPQAHL